MPAKNPLIANDKMVSSVHVLGAAQNSMPVGPMKKHTLSSSGGQAVVFAEKAPASMFSVDAPNALVLSAGALFGASHASWNVAWCFKALTDSRHLVQLASHDSADPTSQPLQW